MSNDTFQPIAIEARTLSSEQLQQFNQDGYIIIPGLLDSSEIRRIKELHQRVEALAQERGENITLNGGLYEVEKLAADHPAGKSVALRKIQEVYKSEPDFASVMASQKILKVITDLIGTEIYYHSSKLMCKPAHGGRRKPWHQDWAYWQEMNTNQVTLWVAIDPSTRENGCMQIIPGSHQCGYVKHSQQEDYMIDESAIDQQKVVYAEMNPGDALIFNVLALHASDTNNSAHDRLSTIIDFDSQAAPEGHEYGSATPLVLQ